LAIYLGKWWFRRDAGALIAAHADPAEARLVGSLSQLLLPDLLELVRKYFTDKL